MSAKPYTDAEMVDLRDHPAKWYWNDPAHCVLSFLATVDALQARLAAAEAECRAREEVQARLIRERNAAEAELDALRAALDAAPEPAQAGEAVVCADCAAGHPRYFVPSNGETIHALPGGTISPCAKAHPAPPAPDAAQLERVASGVSLIAKEREFQRAKWGDKHDDEHNDGILAMVACVLATVGTDADASYPGYGGSWGEALYGTVQNDRVRALTCAGALIAAEIDRLHRAIAAATGGAS